MEWISVKDQLPPVETKVLVLFERFGCRCWTSGMYEDGTINEERSEWGWEPGADWKYDEENDCYIIPEGWWEYKEFNEDDEYNRPIGCRVTHWALIELPEV